MISENYCNFNVLKIKSLQTIIAIITEDKVTEIFCIADDFCKVFDAQMGKCTGISFVDSTPLRVCRTQRIHIHKTFKGIAQRGKCSMGWFFGFKLHLIHFKTMGFTKYFPFFRGFHRDKSARKTCKPLQHNVLPISIR